MLCSDALRDGDAADGHRLELGDRRQRAGAADRGDDVEDARLACRALNLKAIAQRGERATSPSIVLLREVVTLTTMPSIS